MGRQQQGRRRRGCGEGPVLLVHLLVAAAAAMAAATAAATTSASASISETAGQEVVETRAAVRAPDAAGTPPSALAKFLTWCKINGLTMSNKSSIQPDPDRGRRGLYAVEDISQGESLSIIPLRLGLHLRQLNEEHSDALPGWAEVAQLLLQELAEGEQSHWAPYLNILPRQVPLPIFLRPEDVKNVQWHHMIEKIEQIRKSVTEAYNLLAPLKAATLDDFGKGRVAEWAASMVFSRAFTLPVGGGAEFQDFVMMPFMDMINHHYDNNADWMSQPVVHGKLEIVAKRSIKRGQEIFTSFGPRPNDNLFLYYGFLQEDNPFDIIHVFQDMEEAVGWFLDKFDTYCSKYSDAGGQLGMVDHPDVLQCKGLRKDLGWAAAQRAMEVDKVGLLPGTQAAAWWELVNMWGDLGYEYLPYRPGPGVRIGGVVDPALLAAFAALHKLVESNGSQCNVTHLLTLQDSNDQMWEETSGEEEHDEGANEGTWESDGESLQQSAAKDECKPPFTLHDVNLAVAAIAQRCREILQSMPTSLDEDLQILAALQGAQNGRTPLADRALALAVQYRISNKLLLAKAIAAATKTDEVLEL
eukprot:SM000014S00389  [mRNA]  locus=s14:1005314:1008844:- [translate_table: standard]